MELIRPAGSLDRWANQLTSIIPPTGACKSDIEAGHGPWATGVYFGEVTRKDVLIDIEIHRYEDEDEDEEDYCHFNIHYICPSREGILLNAPRCYYELRVGFDEIRVRRDLPMYGSGWGASHSTISRRRDQTIPNNFINAEEIFEYGAKRAIRCANRLLPWTREKLKQSATSSSLTEYLTTLLALGKTNCTYPPTHGCLRRLDLQDRDLLDKVFNTEWFESILHSYAEDIENYVERHGLIFDNEGGWPVKVNNWSGGYSLELKPGYNDVVDSGTEEDIDDNVEGQNRGYSYDNLNRLIEILEDYDDEHTTEMLSLKTDWDGEYDLTEVYPDEYETHISFDLTASRELTVPYILHLLREYY